jgi:Outer membrane receptor for ferrienterochelin and colicins
MKKLAQVVLIRSRVYCFGALIVCGFAEEALSAENLLSLSFEDLMQVKISSVSRREQLVSDAAASIYVITSEAIRNAGVTTLPEALRLDPRLQISRISADQYAIGVRGFNVIANNKMLVLIDGRTVYTSLFSGVFWDHQDLMLEDIERIEVISGPGATLWGTNAVNGVINIITRDSSDTHGWLAAAHGGNFERGARLRYGTAIGEHGNLRVYGKFFETDSRRRIGGRANDGAERAQIGFRSDWKSGSDHITIQGDSYQGRGDDRGSIYPTWLTYGIDLDDIEPSGSNLLARWQRNYRDGADIHVQAYWDKLKRRDAFLFQPESETFDVELQQAVPIGRHRLMWGAGYRRTEDDVANGIATYFIPASRSLDWGNIFTMADLHITDALTTTFGLRLEHNEYTGMEYLPSLRGSWRHSPNGLIWASLSRAVRAPARYDRDVFQGFSQQGPWIVEGGPHFDSEVANVVEIGYRGRSWNKLTYSITTYYHDWDRLRSSNAAQVPLQFANNIEGEVYGAHFWANIELMSRWQLAAGGAYLQKDLRLKPGTTDLEGVTNDTLSNDAEYYGQIRSTIEITSNSTLQISLYHVAQLKNQEVPAHTNVDFHYAWQFHPDLTVSVTAQNLADRDYYEYGEPAAGVYFDRSAWLTLTWEP